jgi:two-component system, OmpR family, phosphate regulon response regulator PhoB
MPPVSSLPVLRHRALLVVESDRNVRLFLERALRRTEAVVVVAEDAEAALAVLTLVRPDLILMDLVLPGLSGLDLARRLRHDSRWPGTKLVALSRLCGPILAETMWAAGFDAHVEMPTTVSELGAVLRRLLTEGLESEGVR